MTVNVIHHLTLASSLFDTTYRQMTKELQENGVHFASLGANMRNVKRIGVSNDSITPTNI